MKTGRIFKTLKTLDLARFSPTKRNGTWCDVQIRIVATELVFTAFVTVALISFPFATFVKTLFFLVMDRIG